MEALPFPNVQFQVVIEPEAIVVVFAKLTHKGAHPERGLAVKDITGTGLMATTMLPLVVPVQLASETEVTE